MAKKKMSNHSKQEQVPQPQSQPPLPTDDNNKLLSLKNLNSLLLKETSHRRQQVQSLESHLSNTSDDNVVSHLQLSIAYAFIKSQISEMGFRFAAEKNDTEHVVSELKKVLEDERVQRDRIQNDFDGVVVDANWLKEKLLEAETRERKLLEELRKVKSEGFEKVRVIGEVTAERDLAVRNSTESAMVIDKLKEKVLEAENREKKLLEELRNVKSEGEKLMEEGFEKERVIGEIRVERDSAVRNSRELKEKVLEAENREKKLLEELRNVKSEGEKMMEEGFEKERVIGEVRVERDSAVRNSRELKEKLLGAENRERKLLEELQKVRLEGEKLIEEGFWKERVIGEVTVERDSSVRNLRELEMVIEKLKGEMDLVMRERDEISKLNDAQKVKISSMELELARVNEALNDVCKEEKLMRGKILELEGRIGMSVKKEEGLMLEIRDLVKQKEEMEGSGEMLKEGRDSVQKVLDEVHKELEDKQREIVEIIRAKNEIENERVRCVEEIIEAQGIVNELNQSCIGFEKKNKELLLEVESYRNAAKEVMVERDNIRKGFDEEKNKVKSLMLQVAEMEGKIEEMAGEIGMMRSVKVKLLEKNETVESRVSALMNEKDALQQSLLEAQQECDDMKAKVELASINSNRVLEMLKSTAATMCYHKEGAEEVVSNEEKLDEEIRLYAEQLDAIWDAFTSKNKMVADMKQQFELQQNTVVQAHKMKNLWTMISSGTSVLAAAFAAAYVAKGH